MDNDLWLVFMIAIYKIASLTVGLAISYMGYRLFLEDKTVPVGDLDAKSGQTRLLLKKSAPGTFFALFGTVVISITILKGFEYQTEVQTGISTNSDVSIILPNEPPF